MNLLISVLALLKLVSNLLNSLFFNFSLFKIFFSSNFFISIVVLFLTALEIVGLISNRSFNFIWSSFIIFCNAQFSNEDIEKTGLSSKSIIVSRNCFDKIPIDNISFPVIS